MNRHKQDSLIKQASGWCEKKDDSVPFRQVYIHALVRDAERQKMSKTKGNVIDPLEIIQRFGTDATRFTLAAMAAPGTDIAFSESRTEGYRNFANKIWNAARFMFMNVERLKPGNLGTSEESKKVAEVLCRLDGKAANLEDRWILSRFNRVVKNVNEALATYRFHEAANRIYDFFWGDFCDWYIELIKPRLNAGDSGNEAARVACGNLVTLFDGAMRLLHPMMPFITEEIWQAVYDGKPPVQSIALAAFPQCDVSKIDESAEMEMGVVIRITTAIRDGKARLKIEPKRRVTVDLYMGDEGRKILRQNQSSIERLANVSLQLVPRPPVRIGKLAISLVGEDPERSNNFVTDAEAYNNLASYSMKFHEARVDIVAETRRLEKELSKVEQDLSNAEQQLSNERFLSKAPPNVIEGVRKRAKELAAMREKTRNELNQLR